MTPAFEKPALYDSRRIAITLSRFEKLEAFERRTHDETVRHSVIVCRHTTSMFTVLSAGLTCILGERSSLSPVYSSQGEEAHHPRLPAAKCGVSSFSQTIPKFQSCLRVFHRARNSISCMVDVVSREISARDRDPENQPIDVVCGEPRSLASYWYSTHHSTGIVHMWSLLFICPLSSFLSFFLSFVFLSSLLYHFVQGRAKKLHLERKENGVRNGSLKD